MTWRHKAAEWLEERASNIEDWPKAETLLDAAEQLRADASVFAELRASVRKIGLLRRVLRRWRPSDERA